MPVPFHLIRGRSIEPIVLTCEHASHRLPAGVPSTGDARLALSTHWGHDLGAWAFTRELADRLATSAIGGRWSRLWVDLNRRVDDPSLTRTEADGVPLPWNQRLTPAEIEQRVITCHMPYHNAIDTLILRRLVRGVRPLVFSVHSFTPIYDGKPRGFDVGILYERHAAEAKRIAQHIRNHGFSVRYNQPYSGMDGMMYAVDRHGSHHRLPCLEIEVNDSLFSNARRTSTLATAVASALRELTN